MKFAIAYTTGRGFHEYTEAQVQEQLPEVDVAALFNHFSLDKVSMVQADGNTITIERIKEEVPSA